MSYGEQSANYRDMNARARYDMCIREQAHMTFANDANIDNAALADMVITGDTLVIDSLMAAICVGPNSSALANDPDLLAAVQVAWPTVAGAYANG